MPAHRLRIEVDVGQHDVAGLGRDATAERVGDRARLLVDLLEHEVAVAALLRHDRDPTGSACGSRWTGSPSRVRDLHAVRGHHRHLAVLEDHHVARVGEDRRDVGGDEHLALAESDDHAARAVLAPR